jgi:hypothetical protein
MGLTLEEGEKGMKKHTNWADNIAHKHQERIARRTLQMPDVLVKVLGGMTKEQARKVLAKARKEGKE